MKTINNNQWGDVWKNDMHAYDADSELMSMNIENVSVRCEKIMHYVKQHIGDLTQKKSVEVGCGGAIYSQIFARMGAIATLIDYSVEALELAERNFTNLGLDADMIETDVFNLSSNLIEKFDVAMSFGTVEHYRYPERLEICRAHVDLLRPGGICIISTPNIFFLPHELLKILLVRKEKWFLGYEGSFSPFELRNVGHKLGLRNIKIIGSSWRADLIRYMNIIRETNTFKNWFQTTNPQVDALLSPTKQTHNWLDDFIGHDIVLLGVKDV